MTGIEVRGESVTPDSLGVNPTAVMDTGTLMASMPTAAVDHLWNQVGIFNNHKLFPLELHLFYFRQYGYFFRYSRVVRIC